MPRKTKDAIDEKNEKQQKNTTKKSVSKAIKNQDSKVTKTSTKKSTSSKKVTTSNLATSKKETAVKKNTTRKKANKSKVTNPIVEVLNSFELPYRYNETVVKILYQTPNTLFVYWDISDKDRENIKLKYEENFFNDTKPVLIIHNETMNYTYEIDINDFANSWYLKVNDTNCVYEIELGRRPIAKFEEIKENYIYISSSNSIESPNDKILFNTNENNSILLRNVKTNNEHSVSLFEIIKNIPSFKKVSNIPYVSEELLKQIYTAIYKEENIENIYKLNNPSSK